jgi:hypothetical protein
VTNQAQFGRDQEDETAKQDSDQAEQRPRGLRRTCANQSPENLKSQASPLTCMMRKTSPGACLWRRGVMASGVTSRGAKPVPPDVKITSTWKGTSSKSGVRAALTNPDRSHPDRPQMACHYEPSLSLLLIPPTHQPTDLILVRPARNSFGDRGGVIGHDRRRRDAHIEPRAEVTACRPSTHTKAAVR